MAIQALADLLDYPELIPNPMDLGTILNKLNNKQYENIEEFLDDFELIYKQTLQNLPDIKGTVNTFLPSGSMEWQTN